MYLNPGTKITCDENVILELAANMNFGEQKPVIGQYGSSIKDLDISGLCFAGNYQNQKTTPNDHGLGYGNFLQFTNCSNSIFHGLSGGNNEGDYLRIQNGANIEVYNNKGVGSGHDHFHFFNIDNLKVHDNNIAVRTGNVARFRTCRNVAFFNNKCYGTKTAYSALVQLEHLTAGKIASTINVENNQLYNSLGPAIWLIASLSGASEATIENNLISSCGLMPAANKLPGVGGIICGGWDKVSIKGNKVKNCKGYSIGITDFAGKTIGSKLKITIKDNNIAGTQKALYPGSYSGTGIANLLKQYSSIVCSGNTFSGNVRDMYGV